ncbi:type II toxin-antitoxin system HicA family toxin [Kamptonema cortianum]|nr:type II toxin-antitoxin system HicA family toxin [Oscillatoria laete-virens]MDK3159972.1 type II toxin-antitoxin system HicA family toxin [Kamptonema cortianum]MDL5047187.1 type II toxin-antitoxin system HicA family toxin [Oscillatoria amoena NRMC-F 0135]MDL5055481.1 type II toxin-antitoxin system HicA family toxin [Oscillatoria laete-virens NRMC-F 0139]
MPRKIRELIKDLQDAGWCQIDGGKGSHRKFAHEKVSRKVILSGKSGADALRYQEKLVKQAVNEVA